MDELSLKKIKLSSVKKGRTMPNGTIYNLDSVAVSIDEFKGNFLVIDFWATWCTPCIKEMPFFSELGEKYKNENIEFITVSVDGTFPYWKKYMEENNWKGSHYWLGMNESEPIFPLTYSEIEVESTSSILTALPKYIFVSPTGIIVHNDNGPKPSSIEFEKKLIEHLNLSEK